MVHVSDISGIFTAIIEDQNAQHILQINSEDIMLMEQKARLYLYTTISIVVSLIK